MSMKRKLLSKKAFTLIEVILSIAIIAAIALPLMSMFVQSVKTQRSAQGVLSASYISQDYIEKLDSTTYESALTNLPNRVSKSGYYLTAQITPHGTTTASFRPCGYMHLVFYESGALLAVMPDGKWRKFTSIPSAITINAGGALYTFTAGSTTLTGSIGSTYCSVLINAMKKPSGQKCTITLSTNCKALRHCKKSDESDITISGTKESYCDMITGDTSLIHVKTYVYELASSTDPVAIGEDYINIRNW